MRQLSIFRTSYIVAALSSLFILNGCGNTPAPVATTPVENKREVAKEATQPNSGLQWESLANGYVEENRDTDTVNAAYLNAVDAYLGEGEKVRAKQLLLALKSHLSDENQRQYYQLLIAEAYQNDADVSPEVLLSLVADVDEIPEYTKRLDKLKAHLYTKQGAWGKAATILARHADDEASVEQVWQLVNQAISENDANLSVNAPALTPYVSLAQQVQRQGLDAAALRESIEDFRIVFRDHPLVQYWPSEVEKAVLIPSAILDDIAVLLPLSGRFAVTGNTVKEGILAAYFEAKLHALQSTSIDTIGQIRFIDTNDKSVETLITDIGGSRWIIGPLLKQNIEAVVTKLDASQTMLALNRVDPSIASTNDFKPITYFSLAPEDEAEQLAEILTQSGIASPIVVSTDNSLYARMHDAFITRWQQINANASGRVTEVKFSDNESLKDGVTGALDVAQSNDRIKQIEDLITEELYKMPRSRRDVDGIVVFASPEHTELLNPIVEASVSPFIGKDIPVYASSRSMDYQKGPNQWRDLQRLKFIDIPWLLPNHPWQRLAKEVNGAKQTQTASQSRLFALGFDAFNLLPNVQSLAALPQLSTQGLTGTLYINHFGEVVRILPKAEVSIDGVVGGQP